MRRVRVAAIATTFAAMTAGLRAQVAAPPGGPPPAVPASESPHGPSASGPREVAGMVERMTRRGPIPMSGTRVILHRVGADTQGPLDSTRTTADGRYRFRYRASGSDRAIYFVSATWGGIAYFTSPLKGTRVTGSAARMTVFDTASVGVPLHVRGRHLIISASDTSHHRTMIEVYELANDSSVTLVASDSLAPTWTTVVPGEARDVKVGQGDLSPEAAQSDAGRLRVFAPFAPGVKQLSFSYRLPQSVIPLSIPARVSTGVLEVLIEDPSGTAHGAQLREVNPYAADGRTFKRFLAQDVAATGVAVLDAPVSDSTVRLRSLYGIAIGVAFALLLGLTVARWRLRHGRRTARADDDPERLAREIADLDAVAERDDPADTARAAEYRAAREVLKERLTYVLARRDGDA